MKSSESDTTLTEPKKIKNVSSLIENFLFGNNNILPPEKPANIGVSTENPDLSQLVKLLYSILCFLESDERETSGNAISELSKLLNEFKSFIWILRGMIAYELTKESRQFGGRGNVDLDKTGCVEIYKQLAEFFDAHWKTIAKDRNLYAEFLISPTKCLNGKIIHSKRIVLLAKLFKLKKGFFEIAKSSKDPQAAIEIAYSAAIQNKKYTIKQFNNELIKKELIVTKTPEDYVNSSSSVRRRTIETSFDTFKLLEFIAKHENFSVEKTIEEALQFYYKAKCIVEKEGK